MVIPSVFLACKGSCSDADREVDVSFRACQVHVPADPQSAGALSVYTYTNVTCNCSAGDITIQVHLPNDGGTVDYRMLNGTANPELLNASQCVNESTDSNTRSYCIQFTNLTMPGGINGSELVAEVTEAFKLKSSTSCSIIIVYQGKYLKCLPQQ